jgi:tRNA modification GTPase
VAPGQGSVAIVRLSGPSSEAIGRRLFLAPGSQAWESHRVLYGHVVDPESGERVDEVLLLLMHAPRSFTREDVVEFHCHGGLVAVRRVLELVLAAGARQAAPGEFSQRAFLHGRLDLTRAEALMEMVTARSRRAAQLAMAGLDGGLQWRIGALRERLLDQLAELEARVDFEEDLPPLDPQAVRAELEAVRGELEALVLEARQGEILREGLRVAIVGRPNVGKSSLLNRLCRRERAIVTDLPGTTRDLLESEVVLEGVPLTLLDTAGIRETSDRVESLGIERSRQALASADAVLLVFDLAEGWTRHRPHYDDKSRRHQGDEDPARDVAAVRRIRCEVRHDPIVGYLRFRGEIYPQTLRERGLFAFVTDAHGVKNGSRDDGHRGDSVNDVEP